MPGPRVQSILESFATWNGDNDLKATAAEIQLLRHPAVSHLALDIARTSIISFKQTQSQ
jgi:hypothetical protein